jgi:hypothetical protein
MLGRPLPDASGTLHLYEFVPGWVGPSHAGNDESAQSAPEPGQTDKSESVQRRLEMMNRQLDQLRRSMEELRKTPPR